MCLLKSKSFPCYTSIQIFNHKYLFEKKIRNDFESEKNQVVQLQRKVLEKQLELAEKQMEVAQSSINANAAIEKAMHSIVSYISPRNIEETSELSFSHL